MKPHWRWYLGLLIVCLASAAVAIFGLTCHRDPVMWAGIIGENAVLIDSYGRSHCAGWKKG